MDYLGLSMNKEQVVNTIIDGEGVKRALIPGHLLKRQALVRQVHEPLMMANLPMYKYLRHT
jgi:hypothetical protein